MSLSVVVDQVCKEEGISASDKLTIYKSMKEFNYDKLNICDVYKLLNGDEKFYTCKGKSYGSEFKSFSLLKQFDINN